MSRMATIAGAPADQNVGIEDLGALVDLVEAVLLLLRLIRRTMTTILTTISMMRPMAMVSHTVPE